MPYYTGSPTYAVPLGEMEAPDTGASASKYILPTRIFVHSDGQCFLSSVPDSSAIANLKTALMSVSASEVSLDFGQYSSSRAVIECTAYLALVLRRARDWFNSRKSQVFGRFTYDWIMNMGLPAAVDDKTHLRNGFKLVARAAWLASVRSGNISLSQCQQAISDVKDTETSRDEQMISDIELVPEVIAQVVGYAKSQSRNDGLHLLVDVGAGTLDVCSFNLYSQDDELQWPVLTADVQPLGTIQLHESRKKAVQRIIDEHFVRWCDVTDPMTIYPSSVEKYLPDQGKIRRSVWKSQCDFELECRSVIGSAIVALKKTRYPNAPDWSGPVPIFVCGGGTNLGPYQESIYRTSQWMKKCFRSSQGLKREVLPVPDSVKSDVQRDVWHRLSVAYGLSYPPFDIGDYAVPSDIEDINIELKKWKVAGTYE